MQAGEIRWNGSVVREPGEFLVPPRCAYVSQVPRLFSEELRSNILLGLPELRVDLPGAIRTAAMERDIEEAGPGPRHRGRPPRGPALGRPGPAVGRCPHVRKGA